MYRTLKSLQFTREENLVRDATADNEKDPNQQTYAQIAEATHDTEKYKKILAMIQKRMTDYPKIQHVKKALLLILYGLDHFCEQFEADIIVQVSVIQRITKYRYYKNGEMDIAGPVREEAAKVLLKLSQEEKHTPQPRQDIPQTQVPQEEEVAPAAEDVQVEEEEVTTAEAQAVKFDDFSSGSVLIEGRTGSNAGRVNGVFVVREGKDVGGKTSYERDAGHIMEDEDPICLWYAEKWKSWMISRESGIGTENAYALVTSGADSPVDIPAGSLWKVFDKEQGKYVDDDNIVIKTYTS